MTDKPTLSVDLELLVRIATPLAKVADGIPRRAAIRELRALLNKRLCAHHFDFFGDAPGRTCGHCGIAEPVDKPTYPRVCIVKAHTHTCSCVTSDSGVCDCGAVVDGVAVEVAPSPRVGEPVAMVEMCKASHDPVYVKRGVLLDAAYGKVEPGTKLYTAPQPRALPRRKTAADYKGYIEPFQAEAAALYNEALDDVAKLWT